MEKEKRIVAGEIRAVDDSPLGEGIIEGYLTKWDTVDSWNTKFKRGAFTKTFQKRGTKNTRLFWNHKELAGKILELREDDYGPFFVGQCNMDTEAGKKCYAHVKAEDVNCNSFGFNTVDDGWVGSVREIREVDMLECGPVIFQANDQATITNFRKMSEAPESDEPEVEERAEDFDTTQRERELNGRGWQLLSSLEWTIDDIYYNAYGTDFEPSELIAKVDTAIAKFHTAYIGWLNEFYDFFESRDGVAPCEFRNHLQVLANDAKFNGLESASTLTSEEVRTLRMGKLLPLEARGRLQDADGELFNAHQKQRGNTIERLCDEIRSSTLTEGEVERITALLDLNSKNKVSELNEVFDFLKDFRSKL